ncbi:hypothetical protein O7628_18140 [Micromonospora sp. WMMD956]|uniref:hypothetical protein n=1 Tax=Micromonospora sp. WMMD956 TaxID=3016108 RepID=UPI002416C165|nr:hypothetical protein [Micromonospora sp. WMMD956]MDG4817415.1 hypothetical protein [Micromonospora sp. WMMD956]
MEELHRQLLRIGFDAGDDLGLVLAGGYAMCAHELVSRPSQDIDFATASTLPLSTVVSRLADAYRHAGFSAQAIEVSPRMARMLVSDGTASCEVDLLKEALGPPARLSIGPVLAFEERVGHLSRSVVTCPGQRAARNRGSGAAGRGASLAGWAGVCSAGSWPATSRRSGS